MQRLNPLAPSDADATQFSDRIKSVNDHYRFARTFRVASYKEHLDKVAPGVLPDLLTWLSPCPDDPAIDQLYIGTQLIKRENWHFDAGEETLDWHQGDASDRRSGTLQLFPNSLYGIGHMFVGDNYFSVEINVLPIGYQVDVSADAGAYAYGCEDGVALVWDKESPEWVAAKWDINRLNFSYGIKEKVLVSGKRYTDTALFSDNVTETAWEPEDETFCMSLSRDLQMCFSTCRGVPLNLAQRGAQEGSVFPCLMRVDFDDTCSRFEGAILTGRYGIEGDVYAIRGVAANQAIAGDYRLSLEGLDMRFSVFGQKLFIDDQVVETSCVTGNTLRWSDLSDEQMAVSGLPAEAWVCFSDNGETFDDGECSFIGRRVAETALSIYIFDNKSKSHSHV